MPDKGRDVPASAGVAPGAIERHFAPLAAMP